MGQIPMKIHGLWYDARWYVFIWKKKKCYDSIRFGDISPILSYRREEKKRIYERHGEDMSNGFLSVYLRLALPSDRCLQNTFYKGHCWREDSLLAIPMLCSNTQNWACDMHFNRSMSDIEKKTCLCICTTTGELLLPVGKNVPSKLCVWD